MTDNRQRRRRSLWLSGFVLCVLFLGIVAFHRFRVIYYQMGTAKQLQIISLALEFYGEQHGHYPPQYLTDDRGKPMHSWRVLILPYLSHSDLYDRYRFDEPWNGPHNRLLANEMPEEYRAPYASPGSPITQYLGIAGRDAAWRGTKPLTARDLQHGGVDVIWFVENAGSDVNWMEPRDIPVERALAEIGTSGKTLRSYYGLGLPAEMTQTHLSWVSPTISSAELKKMLFLPKRDAH